MSNIKGKTVLITGGTGSFGKTVATYLAEHGAREIRIFSRDEEKQDAMRADGKDSGYKYFIGDVRDRRSVASAMKGVDLAFHAAALKQVPSCEFFPLQAVQTNILGSSNVVDCAVEAGVQNMVFLSTDKAVFPINAMGMSKAMMEKVVQAKAREIGSTTDTTLSCVRYGNVLYSRGSVVPLFVKQIRSGKNITITDPDMTRFLMPLSQAVDLVLYAFEHARQGDTFVRKAPAATVGDLAKATLQILGKSGSVQVDNIGIRHGEKMYESLLSAEERSRSDDMGDYFRVPLDSRSLEYKKYFTEGDANIVHSEEFNSNNAHRMTVSEVSSLLLSLPEVQSEVEFEPK